MPMTPGPDSSKAAVADGGEPPETNAPRTDAMTTSHAWAFRTTLRRRAFGWSGTSKVIDRRNAALAEIAAMARTGHTLAGGSVEYLQCGGQQSLESAAYPGELAQTEVCANT